MSKSVLEAIREGNWFFEPDDVSPNRFDATMAVPGSPEKLDVLASRAQEGLPLWHEHDRADYDEPDAEQGILEQHSRIPAAFADKPLGG